MSHFRRARFRQISAFRFVYRQLYLSPLFLPSMTFKISLILVSAVWQGKNCACQNRGSVAETTFWHRLIQPVYIVCIIIYNVLICNMDLIYEFYLQSSWHLVTLLFCLNGFQKTHLQNKGWLCVMCVCSRWGRGQGVLLAIVQTAVYLTGYSDCRTSFHKPLSQPYRSVSHWFKHCLAQLVDNLYETKDFSDLKSVGYFQS